MAIRRVQTALQLRDEQAQRVQRLPQIVAGRSQKTRFGQVGMFELTGSFLDPAFERRVRVLQLRRHTIELFTQHLELVVVQPI
jgi:hypothetical protein